MPTPSAKANIETVAKLESEVLQRRTSSERIAEAVGTFAGSMTFVVLHICVFIVYLRANTGCIPGIRPFDPYPFGAFAMVVAFEAMLLSAFVLMRQNRMSRRVEMLAKELERKIPEE